MVQQPAHRLSADRIDCIQIDDRAPSLQMCVIKSLELATAADSYKDIRHCRHHLYMLCE